MRSLFEYAYVKGRQGYPWHKAPPDIEAVTAEQQKSPEGTPAKPRDK
jgi:hypothetical protein